MVSHRHIQNHNVVRWIFAPCAMHFRSRYDTFWPYGLFTLLQFCKHPLPKSVWNPDEKLNCGDIFKQCFENFIITLKLMTVFFNNTTFQYWFRIFLPVIFKCTISVPCLSNPLENKFTRWLAHSPLLFACQNSTDRNWASIHQAVRRLTARSREVSKPRDSGLNFSNRSEIWQVPRQRYCRGACQISERYDHCNIRSCGFETSRDLAVRRLTA